MKYNVKGFSLVELLIVVAIIATLGAIAIPTYNRYKAEARRGEALGFLPEIYKTEQQYRAEERQYTADITALLFDNPSGDTYYVYSLCNQAGVNLYGTGTKMGIGAPAPADATFSQKNAACTTTGFTGHANGHIDGDATLDNVSVGEVGTICTPDVCNLLDTAQDRTGIQYNDDVNN